MNNKTPEKIVTIGIASGLLIVGRKIFNFFVIALLVSLALSIGIHYFSDHDSTDYENERSNLSVLIDAKTGCHYLQSRTGITKLVDSNGAHICSGKEL